MARRDNELAARLRRELAQLHTELRAAARQARQWACLGPGEHELEDGAVLTVTAEHVRRSGPDGCVEIARNGQQLLRRWAGGERLVSRQGDQVALAEATPYFARERVFWHSDRLTVSERSFAVGTHDFTHTVCVLDCGGTVVYDDLGTHWHAPAA